MGPGDLAHVLRHLTTHSHPALLVGLGASDDAAVYQIGPDQALVQTIDFFQPIVDDPYQFGAIAAANALSDVYAMGGHPLLALNVVAWPEDLDPAVLGAVLQGGADKIAEAGAVVAGGHTVTDREPKYGLAVTGLVHPAHLLTKAGAQPNDVLVLTKALGTGVVTTAARADRARPGDLDAAVASMLQLNRAASEAFVAAGVRAATDITGFGLLGHASEMAAAGGMQFRIEADEVPLLAGAREYARAGLTTGGAGRNAAYLLEADPAAGRITPLVTLPDGLPDDLLALLLDPQTSGGLARRRAAGRLRRALPPPRRGGRAGVPHRRGGRGRGGGGPLARPPALAHRPAGGAPTRRAEPPPTGDPGFLPFESPTCRIGLFACAAGPVCLAANGRIPCCPDSSGQSRGQEPLDKAPDGAIMAVNHMTVMVGWSQREHYAAGV